MFSKAFFKRPVIKGDKTNFFERWESNFNVGKTSANMRSRPSHLSLKNYNPIFKFSDDLSYIRYEILDFASSFSHFSAKVSFKWCTILCIFVLAKLKKEKHRSKKNGNKTFSFKIISSFQGVSSRYLSFKISIFVNDYFLKNVWETKIWKKMTFYWDKIGSMV